MSMSQERHDAGYGGPERRRHRVLITRNTEYHCRDGICVAVRDRHTGEFHKDHTAIGKRVSGAIRFSPNGDILSASPAETPHLGEQLCFSSDDLEHGRTVITSALRAIERPPKDVVRLYDKTG